MKATCRAHATQRFGIESPLGRLVAGRLERAFYHKLIHPSLGHLQTIAQLLQRNFETFVEYDTRMNVMHGSPLDSLTRVESEIARHGLVELARPRGVGRRQHHLQHSVEITRRITRQAPALETETS